MKSEVIYIPDFDDLGKLLLVPGFLGVLGMVSFFGLPKLYILRSYIFAAKLLGGSFLISESVLKSYILARKLLSKILFHVDLLFEAESFVIEGLCEAMSWYFLTSWKTYDILKLLFEELISNPNGDGVI